MNIVQRICKEGNLDALTQIEFEHEKALHWASLYGHIHIVKWLLDKFVIDIEAAILTAIRADHRNIVRALCEKWDKHGFHFIEEAIRSKHFNMIKILLNRYPISNDQSYYIHKIITLVCQTRRHQILKCIIDQFMPRLEISKYDNVLIVACAHNSAKNVQYIINYITACVDGYKFDYSRLLKSACANSTTDVAELIFACADGDRDQLITYKAWGIAQQNVKMLKLLYEKSKSMKLISAANTIDLLNIGMPLSAFKTQMDWLPGEICAVIEWIEESRDILETYIEIATFLPAVLVREIVQYIPYHLPVGICL